MFLLGKDDFTKMKPNVKCILFTLNVRPIFITWLFTCFFMPNFHKYFSIIFVCFREFLFLKIPSWPLSPSLSNAGTALLGHKRKIPSSRNCLSLTASLSEIIRQSHTYHSNSLDNMWMILICSNRSAFSTAHVILFQLLSWPQIFKHLSKKLSALLFMAATINYYNLVFKWPQTYSLVAVEAKSVK